MVQFHFDSNGLFPFEYYRGSDTLMEVGLGNSAAITALTSNVHSSETIVEPIIQCGCYDGNGYKLLSSLSDPSPCLLNGIFMSLISGYFLVHSLFRIKHLRSLKNIPSKATYMFYLKLILIASQIVLQVFLPSQEFQQLVVLHRTKAGADGVINEFINDGSTNESAFKTPTNDLAKKGRSFIAWSNTKELKKKKPSSSKINKVTNIYEHPPNVQISEESDAQSNENIYFHSATDVTIKTNEYLWRQFENTSDSTTFTDNDHQVLPDQPYVRINPRLGTNMPPPNITELSTINTYMTGSVIDTSFFNNSNNKKPMRIKKHIKDGSFLHDPGNVSNYSADEDDTDSDTNTYTSDFYDGYYDANEESLPGAKKPYKKLAINRHIDSTWFDPFYAKITTFLKYFEMKMPPAMIKSLLNMDVDAEIETLYQVETSFESIFCKIMQKSLFIFVHDLFKNILLKQKDIVPSMNDEMRIRVCRLCENFAVTELDHLKYIITHDYIPQYSTTSNNLKEVMVKGFVILSLSAVYHYNSGYRQSMSIEQSVQSIKHIGTFSAGVFSVIINENDRLNDDQVQFVKIYSKNILLLSKLIIMPNYNSNIFDEMFRRFKQLNVHESGNGKWGSSYINLKIFYEKHSIFLKEFRERKSLLGYDKGYLVRLINEWYQIFPSQLINIAHIQNQNLDSDGQISILISFSFIALKFYLDAIVPGMRSIVRASFTGSGQRLEYNRVPNLMRAYRLLTIKEYKIHAIYLLRLIAFLVLRYESYRKLFSTLHIPEFSDFPDMLASERCDRLLNNWKYGNVIHETFRTSFDVSNGSYIERHNYPSMGQSRIMKPPERRISFKNSDEMIEDFEKNKTSLFSQDDDPRLEKFNSKELKNVLDDIENLNDSFRPPIANNSDDEINSNTMRNCWRIEQHIKLGYT